VARAFGAAAAESDALAEDLVRGASAEVRAMHTEI
jgi:hypothetical protein